MVDKKSYGVYAPCNAPFNNMYFTVTGNVSPCWKLPGFLDKWDGTKTIMEIWKGEKFQAYRDALKQNIFMNRCKECEKEINDGVWPLARAYEPFGVNDNGYPALMEMELSNQCNLECIMCSGTLSSGIRKNRDKLPPLPQLYGEDFREQMKEFLPHLKELRFNGGEPLAQKIVLNVCEDAVKIAPNLLISIATNGTVYNKRVQYLMDHCNLHFNVSIDSLIPERYAEIRINGELDTVFKNVKIFNEYLQKTNKNMSIMVNPMNNNYEEMVNYLEFTEELNANLWFNTILYPKHLSIKYEPVDNLNRIYKIMKAQLSQTSKSYKNYHVFEHLVEDQIANWLLDAMEK
tara:strand:- start:1626 stop:2663 length:1038 start_codon:yes stop_codon:yes gene_type:complete